ncbi:hypothetical protein CK203_062844 [Vitis vinifera]|uniref:Uncharacterized protein n=1 Tax=Vitis vinifera TaxID=29760 RepID=A0A438G874_VITVI|nr:hypothetical protein CK203_062844 [Vitis vinifera]
MVAEDPIQKTWEDDSSDLDESVETLSLCDLPMYGDMRGFHCIDQPGGREHCLLREAHYLQKLPVCEDTQKLEDSTEKKQQQPTKGGLLQRGLKSFKRGKESRSKSMDGSHGKGLKLQHAPSSKSLPDAAAENYGLSPRKSADKDGVEGHQEQAERRTPSMLVTSPEEGKKGGGHKRKGKSLWGLLKALGCSSSHANTVAKASPSCNIPQPESVRWVD